MAKDSPAQFARRIRGIRGQIQKALPRAGLAGGLVIVQLAKEKLTQKRHVRSGALRRSVDEDLRSVTEAEVAVAIGSPLHYAKYVEALPDGGYLFEATEEGRARAIAVAGRILEDAIRQGAR